MRARVLIGTSVVGVLALSTGVALAETAPPDPEVVEAPAEGDLTTTTTEATTTTTTAVPPEETTTTTVVVEPDVDADVPEDEAPEDDENKLVGADEHPENHGAYVSAAAHDRSGGTNHGASVSAVARSDAGKPERG